MHEADDAAVIRQEELFLIESGLLYGFKYLPPLLLAQQ
jgi:hypothetical protein